MFKPEKRIICKECNGHGSVVGTQTNNRGTCIFCNGTNISDHASRTHTKNLITIYKWCEDFLDDKKEGWYH